MTTPTSPSPWRMHPLDEAAEILGLGKSTLYRLVGEGLPHHNIRGTGIRFTDDDLAKIHAESKRGFTR